MHLLVQSMAPCEITENTVCTCFSSSTHKCWLALYFKFSTYFYDNLYFPFHLVFPRVGHIIKKKNSFYNKQIISYSMFIFVQPFKKLHCNTRNSFSQCNLNTCQTYFYVAHAILMGWDVQCTCASCFILVKLKFCKFLCTTYMEPRMKT